MIEYFPRTFAGKAAGPNYWPNMLLYTAVENGVTMGDADAAFAPMRAQRWRGATRQSGVHRRAGERRARICGPARAAGGAG